MIWRNLAFCCRTRLAVAAPVTTTFVGKNNNNNVTTHLLLKSSTFCCYNYINNKHGREVKQYFSTSTTTATATSSSSSSSSSSGNDPVKVVVVGSGRMGTIRTKLINSNPKYELIGIVDPVLENATTLAAKYRVRVYNYSTLIFSVFRHFGQYRHN